MADTIVRDASGAIIGIYTPAGYQSIEQVRQQSAIPPKSNPLPIDTPVTLTPVTFSVDSVGNLVTKPVDVKAATPNLALTDAGGAIQKPFTSANLQPPATVPDVSVTDAGGSIKKPFTSANIQPQPQQTPNPLEMVAGAAVKAVETTIPGSAAVIEAAKGTIENLMPQQQTVRFTTQMSSSQKPTALVEALRPTIYADAATTDADGGVIQKPFVSTSYPKTQMSSIQKPQSVDIIGDIKKPFVNPTSASDVVETVVRPSDIDLLIMNSPIGNTPIGAGLVTLSDFYLGGNKLITTTKRSTQETQIDMPQSVTVKLPYISTGRIGTETITTERSSTKSSESESVVETPIPSGFAQYAKISMAEPGTPKAESTIRSSIDIASMLPGVGPAARVSKQLFGVEDVATSRPLTDILGKQNVESAKFASGFIPGTPEYLRDTYATTREDPTRSLVSAGLTVGLVGAGAALRVAGAGTEFMSVGSKAQEIYTGLSKVGTATMGGMYASDVVKRTTGVTIGDIQRNFIPTISEEGSVESARGFGGLASSVQQNFPGWGSVRKNLNVIETQELVPMGLAFSASMAASDALADIATLRRAPEISKTSIRTQVYTGEEGYPTNSAITTKALRSSFESGTLVLDNPAKLGESVMAPYGKPIERIPTGTQIGTPSGEFRVFSGSETPYLRKGGFVGEGHSEVEAAYTSPIGYTYFTKAGGQGGMGFGISEDVFGLYRSPTMNRIYLKQGDIADIPRSVLQTPTRGMGANDPLNPRNIAVTKYLREQGDFGKLYVGQYGKAEWQGLIRPGTSIESSELSGWYTDSGRRVRVMDIRVGGESPEYVPNDKFVVGKFFAELALGTSESGLSGTRITPIALAQPARAPSKSEREDYDTVYSSQLKAATYESISLGNSKVSSRYSSNLMSDVLSSLRSSERPSSRSSPRSSEFSSTLSSISKLSSEVSGKESSRSGGRSSGGSRGSSSGGDDGGSSEGSSSSRTSGRRWGSSSITDEITKMTSRISYSLSSEGRDRYANIGDFRSQGGSGGSGKPKGEVFTERLNLRSMREVLLGSPVKKKR